MEKVIKVGTKVGTVSTAYSAQCH